MPPGWGKSQGRERRVIHLLHRSRLIDYGQLIKRKPAGRIKMAVASPRCRHQRFRSVRCPGPGSIPTRPYARVLRAGRPGGFVCRKHDIWASAALRPRSKGGVRRPHQFSAMPAAPGSPITSRTRPLASARASSSKPILRCIRAPERCWARDHVAGGDAARLRGCLQAQGR